MKLLPSAGLTFLLLVALPALGAETLSELTCKPSVVQGTAVEPTTVTVASVAKPAISTRRYALSGRVRYDDVAGQGYLEMWSHFPNRGRFFSRTLGAGPMQPLSGSSGWRTFSLPFVITDKGFPPPEKLVLNVVLPGGGKVEISPVLLQQFGENEDPTQLPGQWWDASTAGLLGGVMGSLIGCLGGLIGVLSARGRARRLVLGTMRLLIILAAMALALGLYALVISQPYVVYYPLLLLGFLSVALSAGLYRQIRARYATTERRKMQTLEG
jgi:hypothetical protein